MVKSLVSDRARALVKLGQASYLQVHSTADLFHFCQDIGKVLGTKIGLAIRRIITQLTKEGLTGEEKQELETQLSQMQIQKQAYRQQIEQINKTVHPFDEADHLQYGQEVETRLTHCFTALSAIAQKLDIDITLPKASKILKQIPDIAAGIDSWQEWLSEEMKEQTVGKSTLYRAWVEKAVLPYAYWQVHLTKVPRRKKDRALRQYYSDRVDKAKQRFEQHTLTGQLEECQREPIVNWAFQMAACFHRSSSQVEGRNGYLAFVHHAHKGIPEQRRKVLTVVHNFDIRRVDGLTPAQRLFKKDFPDLFEFILENVKDFPPPRTRSKKSKQSISFLTGGQC